MNEIIPAIIGGFFALMGVVLKDALERRRNAGSLTTARDSRQVPPTPEPLPSSAELLAQATDSVPILSVSRASRPRTRNYFLFGFLSFLASLGIPILWTSVYADSPPNDVVSFLFGAALLLTVLFTMLGTVSIGLRLLRRAPG